MTPRDAPPDAILDEPAGRGDPSAADRAAETWLAALLGRDADRASSRDEDRRQQQQNEQTRKVAG